jgi:hypothetical protein
MTAIHIAQLPGTPKAIYDLIMLGQEESERPRAAVHVPVAR